MKVVHLSTTDFGGAYKATTRIHESMELCGIESEILIRTKAHDDTPGKEIFTNGFQKIISKVKNGLNLLLSEGEIISDYFGKDISKNSIVQNADVVILHWVNSFISYRNVEQLVKIKKPIILVMHDMWVFTGGCHCDHNCGKYETGCGNCPLLKKQTENDISRRNFVRKQRMFQNGNICIVGPSKWIVSCAQKSPITNRQRIERIPNPIDTTKFHPIEKEKELYGKYFLDNKKRIILYGAMNAVGDKNKGFLYLKKAISKLDKNQYQLVIFGNRTEDLEIKELISTRFLGYIHEEERLIELYNLADVFVCPSQQENYPNSVLEAQACNTPVVAFSIGGIPDIVEHKKTGYLCSYGDTDEMARGIEFCVGLKQDICDNIKKMNAYSIIGERYINLVKDYIYSYSRENA